MLEVIDKGSCSESHPVPVLFAHGENHAAWCWDENSLDFFAHKCYRALAVSLRGHGRSPTSKPLRKCSLADYVNDVAAVADTLGMRPVIVGHSMGGFCGAEVPGVPRCAGRRAGRILSPKWSWSSVTTQDETAPMAFGKGRRHGKTVARVKHPRACPRSLLLCSHTRA
jgi:hypothetical protein